MPLHSFPELIQVALPSRMSPQLIFPHDSSTEFSTDLFQTLIVSRNHTASSPYHSRVCFAAKAPAQKPALLAPHTCTKGDYMLYEIRAQFAYLPTTPWTRLSHSAILAVDILSHTTPMFLLMIVIGMQTLYVASASRMSASNRRLLFSASPETFSF